MVNPKNQLKPNYRILVNDADVTASVRKYFQSLQLTDNESDDADELVLTLSAKFKRPNYKDKIKVYLGWGNSLSFAGLFYVQTNNIRNNKHLTITATGASFNGDLKERRSINYEQSELLSVVQKIAERHGLEVKSNIQVNSIFEQVDESDLAFLNRLSKLHNAIFNIKNNTIYFMQKGSEVPVVTVDIDKCSDSDITYSSKTHYNSSKAIYHDTKLNKVVEAIVGEGTPQLTKQGSWQDHSDALEYAQNALVRANKGSAEGSLTMSGKVVFAGSQLLTAGEAFEISTVTHDIASRWSTSLTFKSFSKA